VVTEHPGFTQAQRLFVLKERMRDAQRDTDARKLYEAGKFPSEPTLGVWYRTGYAKLSDKEKSSLQIYRWPDSHENLDLPWEAASVGLQFIHHTDYDTESPPSVGEVRWAYRLMLATADNPMPWGRPDWLKDHPLFKNRAFPWLGLGQLARYLHAAENAGAHHFLWRPTIVSDEMKEVQARQGSSHSTHPVQPMDSRISYKAVIEDYLVWQPWVSGESWDAYNNVEDGSQARLRGPIGLLTATDMYFLLGPDEAVKEFQFNIYGDLLSEFQRLGRKVFNLARVDGQLEALAKEEADGDDTQE
jgi:hypothetical protein